MITEQAVLDVVPGREAEFEGRVRASAQSISQTFTVIAVSLMPLAGAVAISFSAPLWAALLSILWLKERAGPARWCVLLTGFSRRRDRHQSGRGLRSRSARCSRSPTPSCMAASPSRCAA